MSKLLTVTDESFETDILQSEQPVMVDFWASWCGPCKMLTPVVEEVSSEYANKIKIYKMNVEDNPDTPAKYGIQGIPTLLIFKGGEITASKSGMMTKAQLTAFIDSGL